MRRSVSIMLVSAWFAVPAGHAATPQVTLGGYADFQAGWTDSDLVFSEGTAFRNDNELVIRADGRTETGLDYGAVIELETDTTGDIHSEGFNAGRTYTYLQDDGWGRIELGSNDSAAATMRVDASRVAVATGGINGDWADHTGFLFFGSIIGPGLYITRPALQVEHGDTFFLHDDFYVNATKITYYSPRMAGFRFGVSYTPDINGSGQVALRVDPSSYSHVLNIGLDYHRQLDEGVNLAAAITYERARDDDFSLEDIEGANAGALLDFGAWQVAGSYGKWLSAATDSSIVPDVDGEYITAGISYDAGALAVSATYLASRLEFFDENDFTNLVLGADYALAPGISPYVEASFYNFDGIFGPTTGTTVLFGTLLAF